MTRRRPIYPGNAYPPRMLAAMAAGYVGEADVPAFLERVAGGQYPQPYLVESQKRRWWLKKDLDAAMGIAPQYHDQAESGRVLSMGERFIEAQNRKRQSGTA